MSYLINSIFSKYHNIEEQVIIKNYKIDFVIDNKIAIECDEDGHKYYNQNDEKNREETILDAGLILLRYDTRGNNMLEFVGEIFELI